MKQHREFRRLPRRAAAAVLVVLASSLGGAGSAGAQAWSYPAFQVPRVTTREFNFVLADAGVPAGESFVFQWREGTSRASQLGVDFGFADSDEGRAPGETYLLAGVGLGHQLVAGTTDTPFDVMLTVGAHAAVGDPSSYVSIPVGISLGPRIPLAPDKAVTFFLHPRVAIDYCSECVPVSPGVRDSDVELGVDADVGVSINFTRQLAVRLAGSFHARDRDSFFVPNDGESFGVSLAWTPALVSR